MPERKAVPKPTTIAMRVNDFNHYLATVDLIAPPGFAFRNPFAGPEGEHAKSIADRFYNRFYGDSRARRLILGSSPARRGTVITGVPFADAEFLRTVLSVDSVDYRTQKTSADFLSEVIELFGGHETFYNNFMMNFLFPIGVVKVGHQGRQTNANYYDSKALVGLVEPFIVDTISKQLELGVDTSECLCIGSGTNFKFLEQLNTKHKFFNKITPLAHPRYITQYRPRQRQEYLDQYLSALRDSAVQGTT